MGDNHHHLICRACNRMVDVDCAVGDTPCLRRPTARGYEIDEAEVIYWGRCPEGALGARVTARRNHTGEEGNTKEGTNREREPSDPAPEPKRGRPQTNKDWWPDQLALSVLHEHSPESDPMGADYDYAEEFAFLDVEALKRDVMAVMTDSQDRWPADYGHYGPLFIRMSWHAAGTTASPTAGAAGQGRAALRPAQQLARQRQPRQGPPPAVAGQEEVRPQGLVGRPARVRRRLRHRVHGLEDVRLRLRPEDIWEPEEIFWGPEDEWLGDERYGGDRELTGPSGPCRGPHLRQPRGPNGNPTRSPRRATSARRSRMAMNDEETAALIVGGHTFGKCHGAVDPENLGPEPEAAPSSTRAWVGRTASRPAWASTRSRAAEGRVDQQPDPVGQRLPRQPAQVRLRAHDEPGRCPAVEADRSRGGRRRARRPRPDKRHAPMMLTSDLALKFDPIYEPIIRRFHENPDQLADAFARAWYKLLHRDMGPVSRYLGPWVGAAAVARPGAGRRPRPGRRRQRRRPQGEGARLGLSVGQLVQTAWAQPPPSATRPAERGERRPHPAGAAEGLGRQPCGLVDTVLDPRGDPAGLRRRPVRWPEGVAGRPDRPRPVPGVEKAAKDAGVDVTVPFAPGRTDATDEDDRRRHVQCPRTAGRRVPQLRPAGREAVARDAAGREGLHAAPVGARDDGAGRRHAGARRNQGGSAVGVLTDKPGTLTNDFFVNLLEHGHRVGSTSRDEHVYEGRYCSFGRHGRRRRPSAVDLVFGSQPQAPGARRGVRQR